MIEWKCFVCKEDMEAPDTLMRTLVKCPACQNTNRVPLRLRAIWDRYVGPRTLVAIFTIPAAWLTFVIGQANGRQEVLTTYTPEVDARWTHASTLRMSDFDRDFGRNLSDTRKNLRYEQIDDDFVSWIGSTAATFLALTSTENDLIQTGERYNSRYSITRSRTQRPGETCVVIYRHDDSYQPPTSD